MSALGKLSKVPLRDEWVHEAHVFTRWLARPENLGLLAEELDLNINLDEGAVETEVAVGRYNVDIVARESAGDRLDVIENQLEHTDHDHLGKVITYAAGLDATFVVWIVSNEREEHKRAIDWLNEHTDAEISFFLVRIELWQIGDSQRAPKFVVVSKPNDWAKAVKHSSENNDEPSATKLRQLEFWENFRSFGTEERTSLRLRKPGAQHWYDISTGSSRWHIALTLNTSKQLMACEAYIPEDKELFRAFESERAQIEAEIGQGLEWMELPDKKASRVKLSTDFDLSDDRNWPTACAWLIEHAEAFLRVFGEVKA